MLAIGAAIIPVVVSLNGFAVFRVPNQLIMYGISIATVTCASCGMLWKPSLFADFYAFTRIATLLAIAAVSWTIVVSLTSRDPIVSAQALPFVLSVISVALVASYAFRRIPRWIVAAAVGVPVVINVAVMTAQATRIWNPWVFDTPFSRMHKNALLGNPNDVGAYLVAPLILLASMAIVERRGRFLYAVLALVAMTGIVLSETITSIVAAIAALLFLAMLRFHRNSLAVIVAAIFVSISTVFLFYRPLLDRASTISAAAELREFDRAMSGRLPAFVTAWQMFRDEPITGVGPGMFKQEYLAYHTAAAVDWGTVFTSPYLLSAEYFREVHNDHLQLLAEAGVPAYGLFLVAVWILGSVSLRSNPAAGATSGIAQILALPLVVGLTISMLAGFPLQLAPSAYTFALVAGACLAWKTHPAGTRADAA